MDPHPAQPASHTATAAPLRESMLGIIALILGLATLLAVAVFLLLGRVGGMQSAANIVIWGSEIPAAIGVALAVAALAQRRRAHTLAAYALWINGLIVVLAAPIAVALKLSM